MRVITASDLKQIRTNWKMDQSQFAGLLGANVRTYQDWEQGRFPVPATVQAHIRTIEKLKTIYEAWDKFATPLAGTEEFDHQIDDFEKLWDQLFPELCRL